MSFGNNINDLIAYWAQAQRARERERERERERLRERERKREREKTKQNKQTKRINEKKRSKKQQTGELIVKLHAWHRHYWYVDESHSI